MLNTHWHSSGPERQQSSRTYLPYLIAEIDVRIDRKRGTLHFALCAFLLEAWFIGA